MVQKASELKVSVLQGAVHVNAVASCSDSDSEADGESHAGQTELEATVTELWHLQDVELRSYGLWMLTILVPRCYEWCE
jgi:hypothetical protein